ncbi:MAG: cation transporter [Clostridia bacterium]|nr:cation transporter [Clostridia bacterium]
MSGQLSSATERDNKIIRTSLFGIAANLVLVVFKGTVGFLSGSIAVILDAVNNLSDALSSVITIIGTKIAGRKPDKKHPFGHGRVEYLTGAIIAILMLLAGATCVRESVIKILSPTDADYNVVSFVILTAAVIAKWFMGSYVKSVGKKINSSALIASGSDAFFDAILSLGALTAAILKVAFDLSTEGIFGAVISLFIIRSGIEMLSDTLSGLIGTRTDRALTDRLKETIASHPPVRGVYDLILHHYGPNLMIGSAHIELPDDITAREIHRLTRKIAAEIYVTFGIVLTLGIYASNDADPKIAAIKADLERIAGSYPEILQTHGFYVEETHVTFDIIVDFHADAAAIRDALIKELAALYPGYTFTVVLDSDYSD